MLEQGKVLRKSIASKYYSMLVAFAFEKEEKEIQGPQQFSHPSP